MNNRAFCFSTTGDEARPNSWRARIQDAFSQRVDRSKHMRHKDRNNLKQFIMAFLSGRGSSY